jgi:pyruvate,water dikinase
LATPRPRLRQGLRLVGELLTTVLVTPRRAQRLFVTMRREARRYAAIPLVSLDDGALTEHLMAFAGTSLHPARLRRLHEIVSAQSRAYMILERLLAEWVPAKAESLLTQLMTGLGTLPNARLTYRLLALGAVARTEPRVQSFLTSAQEPGALGEYRSVLAGTRFLADLDELLGEFGHRGPFESDVMSPRFADDPEPILRTLQAYLRAPHLESPDAHQAERRRIREAARDEARAALRAGRTRLASGLRWAIVSVVCSALQRLLADRDENRHVTTMLVTHLRHLALEIGRRAVHDGRLETADDVFFLLWHELPEVLGGRDRDWHGVVAARRRERRSHEAMIAPDLLRGDEPVDEVPDGPETADTLTGYGVSPGTVIGTVKLVRSRDDLHTLAGEIAVLPTIEPSLAAVFPVVGGLVAEMGGILSHAAILAREYGLPAVVNVKGAAARLRDGDRIELNGTSGVIRVLGRAPTLGHETGAVLQDQHRDHHPDQRARDHV